jgi:hypothetical protein
MTFVVWNAFVAYIAFVYVAFCEEIGGMKLVAEEWSVGRVLEY